MSNDSITKKELEFEIIHGKAEEYRKEVLRELINRFEARIKELERDIVVYKAANIALRNRGSRLKIENAKLGQQRDELMDALEPFVDIYIDCEGAIDSEQDEISYPLIFEYYLIAYEVYHKIKDSEVEDE